MLFKNSILNGLANGSVTVAFRRWKQERVKKGSQLRTPIGIIEISFIEKIKEEQITEPDIRFPLEVMSI